MYEFIKDDLNINPLNRAVNIINTSFVVKDGETGFVIENQNSNQLAEKIKWFIDYPERAILMGKNGKEHFLENYTLEIFENNSLDEIIADGCVEEICSSRLSCEIFAGIT